jgi:glycosyltransferase involved in cell wall biosynthesis
VGISATDAEYIVPLDADDWIEPTYVGRCLEKMANGVGVVATQMVWPGGEIESPQPPFTVGRLVQRNLLFSCSMFKATAWDDAGGYSEDWHLWEDWDFWLRIVEQGWEIATVMEPLFHFGHRNLGEMPKHLTPAMRAEWTMNVKSAHAKRMMARVKA